MSKRKMYLKTQSDGSHYENVLAYYMDDQRSDEEKDALLSEYERDLKKRWETAFTSMLEFRSVEDTVKRLVSLFGVSKATAYRDIQRTEMLFGSFKRYEKEAWRYISIERKHKLYQLALKDKDLDLAHKIDKEIDKLIGLDKEDAMVNLEKIESNSYEISISKKQQILLKQLRENGKGVVDMNVSGAIDIDFEEINAQDGEE